MVLGLGTQVLEDALLPETLHEVPVLDDAVPDGVLGGVGCSVRLIPDVEVWGGGGVGTSAHVLV